MREKLFNLIGQVQDCGCDVTDVVAMNFVENDKLVDWLIANGVVIPVRCKDCKHRRYHSCYREADRIEEMMTKKGIIFVHNAPTYSIRSLDDFCSYGEGRTDNERKAVQTNSRLYF